MIVYRSIQSLIPAVLSLIVCCTVTGCGGSSTAPRPMGPEERNLANFFAVYNVYRTNSKGRPSTDIEEVKKWATNPKNKDKLASLKLDNIEQVFKSPRDNEPYEIVYLPMGIGPIVAHERTGVGGKRLVVTSQGAVLEYDQEQFDRMMETTRRMQTMGPQPRSPKDKAGAVRPANAGQPGKKEGTPGNN